ncbi:hypothetical protein GCM10009613_61300 [Pseudonocardia kongjuensis]|uniref:DUF5047 domain-containing protein n=1 Tax=Pseudonocardia kongjuensis TaxID=102227 RepID=A0ABN1YBZ8_9PSEU
MLPLSAAAAEVIRTSHQINRRVTAYTDTQGALVLDDVADATVACDLKSAIRRTATAAIANPNLWPANPNDVLSEVSSEIGIEYGIVVPRAGTEWLTVFRGPIQTVKAGVLDVRAPDPLLGGYSRYQVSGLAVTASARAQRVVDYRLPSPIKTIPGPVVNEIIRLIQLGDPGAEVLDTTGGDASTAASIEIDKDLWGEGILKLAASAGLTVDNAPSGVYRIRKIPTLDDPPVWRIDAGGVLVSADLERTRAGVYNAVQVTNGRTDGTPTVSELVVDDDPASPTFWGGRFGRKTRFYANPAITTRDQAIRAGRGLLAKARGISCTVTLTAVPNGALEEGDVVEVDLGDGRLQLHILDSFGVPLTPAAQALTTRSLELPAEQ